MNSLEIFGCTGKTIYGEPQVAFRLHEGFIPGPFGGKVTRFGSISLVDGTHTSDVQNSLPQPTLVWQLSHWPPGRAFEVPTIRVSKNGTKDLQIHVEPPEQEIVDGIVASPATITAQVVGTHPELRIPKVILELT